MRALTIFDRRLAVVDAAVPEPRGGEVLVDVAYSAINGMDLEVCDGGWRRQAKGWRKRGPVLTGIELSGVARTSGDRIKAGDRVIGYSHVLSGPRTHAEVVAMCERDLEVVPDQIDLDSAVALVVGGLTAIDVVERLRPLRAGKRVLIGGAAGGVGVSAVQLAKARGAYVVAVASPANKDWLLTQGASEVRDGRGTGWWRPGDRFDLVLDTPAASSFADTAPHLARGGMYVSTNPQRDLSGFARAALSSKRAGWLMLLRSDPAGLAHLLARATQGVLSPVVDSVHDLDDAAAAFERVATRDRRGRVLLRIARNGR